MGVFQLESTGMRDALRRMRADSFGDIVALVALYRPGPMDNIPRYIACKHGEETPDYLYPSLEGILKETFGVIIYQEQVMEIARVLSGYSLGAADLLRRAMGKKIKSEMDAQRQAFVDGAVAREVPKSRAAHIFDLVAKFAGYGFNKSHAAAYALVAYQTAYLKANHPVEFIAASMSLELGNTDKINGFRRELDRLGIALLPPDINRSGVEFTVEEISEKGGEKGSEGRRGVRYALAAIKNVGAQAMRALIDERETNGPFADLLDFARRLDPRAVNRRQLENLAIAGAFDRLDANRARVFAAIETLLRFANAAVAERESNQVNLFGGAKAAAKALAPMLPKTDDWPVMERLRREYDALGFYLSAHPLEAYAARLDRIDVTPIGGLAEHLMRRDMTSVNLAGVSVGRQERRSSKGGRYAFVQLSDQSGTVEVAFFSEVLAATREFLDTGRPLFVAADARLEGESLRVTAREVRLLDDVVRDAATELTLRLADGGPIERLRAMLEKAGRGRGRVILLVEDGAREIALTLPDGYAIDPTLSLELGAIPGIVEVSER